MIRVVVLALALCPGLASAEPAALSVVAVGGVLNLQTTDILSISGENFGGEIDLLLVLTAQAGAELARFTGGLVGQTVSITFCGQELVRPQVMSAITGGRLALGGLSDAVATALVDVIEGRADCKPAG